MKYTDDTPSRQELTNRMKKSTAQFLKDNPGAKVPREFKDTMPGYKAPDKPVKGYSLANRMNDIIGGVKAAGRDVVGLTERVVGGAMGLKAGKVPEGEVTKKIRNTLNTTVRPAAKKAVEKTKSTVEKVNKHLPLIKFTK